MKNAYAHLRDEEKHGDSVQPERDANEPEAELPGQVLDHVAADERSSAATVRCERSLHRETHRVIPAIMAKLHITERDPRSWTLFTWRSQA